MKPINEIIPEPTDLPGQTNNCYGSLVSAEQWAKAWRLLYGMKLVTFDAVDKDGQESRDYTIWRRALSDLTEAELNHGLKKARDFEGNWLALNSFRKLCRFTPEDLGLPTAKEAYYEACLAPSPKIKATYSHPIVFHAGQAAGWWFLKTKPESEGLRHFTHFYDIFVGRVRAGETFKIQAALEEKPQADIFHITPDQLAKEKQRFRDLKKMLGCKGENV